MRLAKYLPTAVLSLVLINGLLSSQVCAFNCAFNGCSITSAPAQKSTNENAHCHQHKKDSAPQKQGDSRPCAAHFEAIGLPSSGTSAPSSSNPPLAHEPTAARFLVLNRSSE